MYFSVRIDGADISDIGLIEGLEISRRSDEAVSTARVQFMQNLSGGRFAEAAAIKEWSLIEIVEQPANFPRFGGYIAEITRDAADNEKYRADCRCVDYGILFERKISSQVFTDARDDDIAIALSTEAGIPAPAANVDFTNILAEFDARDLTVREAFERLCEITGCRWHVDTSKSLRYHKPGLHFLPFNLSDTPDYSLSYPYQMAQFNREFSSAANKMLFLGGPGGDGSELRVTREDTASQAAYGVIEAVKVDRSITAAPVAALLLDAELDQRAFPRVSGRAVIRRPAPIGQVLIGMMTGVKSALYGVDGNFLIFGLRYFIDHTLRQGDGTVRPEVAVEIEFGQRESDLVSMIRILARKDASMPAAVIGPDTVIPADNIVGVIDASHIGGVAAENIEGTIVAEQIGTVSATSIQGIIGGPGSTATVSGQSITGAITGEDVTIGATQITGVIVGAQLTDQILDSLRLVGSEMGVVERIPSSSPLPALPNLEYPDGSTVMWNAIYGVSVYGTARYGSVLYEASGTQWIKTSASAKLTGILKYNDIESIQAQQITGLIIANQIASITAQQITGVIQGNQIGTINASSITAVNAAAITGPISATNITSLNAGDITMVTLWDKDQIGSVKASSITAGTITATVTMTSPDIQVTGSGYNLVLNNTVGLKITATSTTRNLVATDCKIIITGTSGYTSTLHEAGIDAIHPTGAQVQGWALSNEAHLLVQYTGSNHVQMFADASQAYLRVQYGGNVTILGSNFISTSQVRFANSGAITVVTNPSKSITVYDLAGNVFGKVPVY